MERALFKLSFIIMIPFVMPAGCLNLQRNYPDKHYFMLDVTRGGTPSSRVIKSSVKIRRLRVAPPFEGKGFVYRRGDLNYDSDFYNEFFIPPGPMITGEVREWLEEAGLFQHVLDVSSRIDPVFSLDGEIRALYGDYREGTSSKATLEIQFSLIREDPSPPDIVFQKNYAETAVLKGIGPEALVKGWNRALQQILDQFETDLRETDLGKGECRKFM